MGKGVEYNLPVTTGLTSFPTAARFFAIMKDSLAVLKELHVSGWKFSSMMSKKLGKLSYDSSALLMMWYVGFFQFFLLDATLTLAQAWNSQILAARKMQEKKDAKAKKIMNTINYG